MHWGIRYAVTRKGLKQVQRALPDGWEVQHWGQPSEDMWFPPEEENNPVKRRKNFSTPDVIKVGNPKTGNSILLLDHTALEKGGKYIARRYWNVRTQRSAIKNMASCLDLLDNNLTLHLGRDSKVRNKYGPAIARGFYRYDNEGTIYLQSPDYYHNPKGANRHPSWANQGSNLQRIIQTIIHEHGHMHGSTGQKLGTAKYLAEEYVFDRYPDESPQIWPFDKILEESSPSIKGRKNVREFYAEHYTYWTCKWLEGKNKHPELTQQLAEAFNWPDHQITLD